MKNTIGQRIKRIEDLLRNETEIGMVVIKTGQGIEWNGNTYLNDESLQEAMNATSGSDKGRPLVIISIYGYEGKQADQQSGGIA
jgi:hypothetical protein